jgi:hypothetical protein
MKKGKIKFSWFILLGLCFQPFMLVNAQEEREVNDQLQFWTSINSTLRFTDKLGLMGDFHIKRNNFIKDPEFYFLRFGGIYWLDDQFSFAGGVAGLWLATETNQGLSFGFEKRIYQQVLWRTAIRRVVFLQRIRNEQRWHEVLNDDGNVNRVRFSNRVRFLLSWNIKVFNNEELPKLVLSDEILFHFGDEIVYNTFDQNRFFIGINYGLNKIWTFDLGYMLIYQQLYSGYQYDMNHTIRIFFYYSPDFRKYKNKDLPHYPIGGSE